MSEPAPSFCYLWRYRVKPDCLDDFLAAYRPGGARCELFERDPEWLETRLLRSSDDEYGYVTIDRWTSRAARDAFVERCNAEFHALDDRCEAWTASEEALGDYEEVGRGG